MKQLFDGLLRAATALLLCACAAPKPPPATLYERLGGTPVMSEVVSRTLDRTVASPLTQRSFEGVNIPYLKKSLIAHVCAVADGGCVYDGETMARAHRAAKIQPSEFDAMVGFMREEMDRASIDPGAKNDLLRLLAPMKRDIVPTN